MPRQKNTHATHLEDLILEDGSQGGLQAIRFLRYLSIYLSGNKPQGLKTTTKFDGAPAIVCGIDPSDKRFFISTKSAFSKSPKLVKSVNDAAELFDGDLSLKLQLAYQYLEPLGIKGVIQGDLMFAESKVRKKINGKEFITFRPNTITYAVDPYTPLGRQIDKAKLGIVFHTKYEGDELSTMTSSFDIDISYFKQTPNVWCQTADVPDITGMITFSKNEQSRLDSAINKAEGSLKQCSTFLDTYLTPIEGNNLAEMTKTFFNQYVKQGQVIPSVNQSMVDLVKFVVVKFNEKIDKVKTEQTKLKYRQQLSNVLDFLQNNEKQVYFMMASYQSLQIAKKIVLDKLKKISEIDNFIEKDGNFEVTSPEGFMAISDQYAVKLVDRLEFSLNNFTVPKTWG